MRYKKIASSKYRGVCKVACKDNQPWLMSAKIDGLNSAKRYTTEEDAGKAWDLLRLRHGLSAENFYTIRK